MSEAVLLYCVGATKAGTSWFYRALHDHPDCALPAVKEVHYWDTFDDRVRDRQVAAYRARLDGFRRLRAEAAAAGDRDWQVANMDRRIAEMAGLIEMLTAPRDDDRGYAGWMTARLGRRRLTADMTPAYATLPAAAFRRMADLSPRALFVYLLRDPLARLWSHVRMQAERQKQPGETFAEKANNILWRILNRGQETHILARGDYPATVARLRAAVPETRLRVEFCERLYGAAGQRDMAEFLGIGYHPADGQAKAHEGPRAEMRADLAAQAVRFLKDHYDWAARSVGPLPQAWQDNMARA